MATETAEADARIPADHPFIAHLRRVADAETAQAHRAWEPSDGPLPSLYLSHGAPPLFEDARWMAELHAWARSLPRPRAVLIVSAHWQAAPIAVSAAAPGTPLVYDFGGFAPLYSTMRYATPDASALARRVVALVSPSGPVHERARGLDHGAWVPLKVMYPAADIPVLQLSLPTDDPARLLGLGARLRELREEGVLVVGSGFMTHGLPYIDWHRPDLVPAWSAEFDAWAADALGRGELDELVDYRHRAPALRFAHPTVEHFTPLFVTLGAASDPSAPVKTVIEGYFIGLAKRSFEAT